jgi:hypothetical protein
MARVVGFESTPNILGDSTEMLERPRRERPVEVAEVTAEQPSPAPETPAPRREKPVAAARGAALQQRYQDIRAEYEPKLATPAPQFEAPKESFTQLGSLGALMMVMGTMAGSKGLTSATGAMNAMAGMMSGYQQGNRDAFARAKMEFEQSYKQWQINKNQIKEAFARAMKSAPQDIQGATNRVIADLNAAGATTLASAVKTQGLQATSNMYAEASDKADKQIETISESIGRMTTQAAPTQRGVQLAGPPVQGDTPPAEAPARRAASSAREPTPSVATQKSIIGLENYVKDVDGLLKRLEDPAAAKKIDQYRWQMFASEEGGKIGAQLLGARIPEDVREFMILSNAIRNAYYLDISGKAVTGGEAMRNYNVVPQPGDPASTLRIKFKVLKDKFSSDLNNYRRAYPTFTGKFEAEQGQAPAARAPARPTLDEFLQRAKTVNPNVSDEQLTEFYRQRYGTQ